MFRSVRTQRRPSALVAIDIAPLIDVVFILLIFFIVNATFVQDTGIEVERPQAQQAQALAPLSLRVSVAASGALYTEGRQVTPDELTQRVRAYLVAQPDGGVILIPDASAPAGHLVQAMDAAKRGGARDLAVATLTDASGR